MYDVAGDQSFILHAIDIQYGLNSLDRHPPWAEWGFSCIRLKALGMGECERLESERMREKKRKRESVHMCSPDARKRRGA